MPISPREFTREFPRHRRAALAGKAVQVRDREGNHFVFQMEKPATAPSLAEAMQKSIGTISSGSARKSLAGYGRD